MVIKKSPSDLAAYQPCPKTRSLSTFPHCHQYTKIPFHQSKIGLSVQVHDGKTVHMHGVGLLLIILLSTKLNCSNTCPH